MATATTEASLRDEEDNGAEETFDFKPLFSDSLGNSGQYVMEDGSVLLVDVAKGTNVDEDLFATDIWNGGVIYFFVPDTAAPLTPET